ncbi:carboxypeptidase-like protein [Mucilaginibacter gracilis]|uniref:Carboxypeptidase-like protein n=2 Tax=Mucilaginibacter gracilis TaxID=423350 RepID=A0A495IYN5_9SPHI|nr:carboxypeptidase-like protein [Mucilaginibacter gracilis]
MRTVVTAFLFFSCSLCFAQGYLLDGKISDIHGNPLAFVPVYIKGTTNGTIANEQGVYQLKLQPGTYTVVFRFIGYEQQTEPLVIIDQNVKLNIKLEPESYTLESYLPQDTEVDSSYVIMRQVIARRKFYLNQVKEYNCRIYLKADQKLLSAPHTFLKADVAKILNLDPERRGIISLFESISQFNHRRPGKVKEIMLGLKSAGGENPFGFNRATDLQVNLYENLLSWGGMSNRAYISPIADNALRFYKYRLLQRFTDDDKTIDVIEVTPKHENEHVFHGVIYVIENDWRLYSADLHLYKRAHIDFVDTLNIREQYIPVTDSVWVPLSLNFSFTGTILGFKYAGYFLGIANNYDINPHFKKDFFNGEVFEVGKNINKKDSVFWSNNRQVPLLDDEKRYYHLFELAEKKQNENHAKDSVKSENNKFRLIPYVLKSYTYRDPFKKITINVPSPAKMVFYNTVEGVSADVKPQFLKEYDRHKTLTVEPEARYGNSNKIFTFNTNVNYRYNPLKQAAVYGSFGSDFLDLNNSGTLSLFLNSLSTLFTGNNYLKLYKAKFASAGTQGEIMNGVLLNGQIEYAHRETVINTSLFAIGKDSTQLTSNDPVHPHSALDINSNVPLFPNHNALSIRTSATITFNQQYTINPDGKFIEPTKYPRMRINYRKGFPIWGSIVDYDFLSVDFFQDQLKCGIYGFASYFVSVGKFFNAKSLFYPDYKQFRGGQSFFFDSSLGSFHFLDYYTYSTDKKYFEAHYEHNFAGYFLGRVPYIRSLNIEEVIGGSYLTQELLRSYKEYYVGLKRSVVRLDYGFSYGENLPVLQGFRFTYNF